MNRLTKDKRARVVAALVEGSSIRSACRMTGVAKGTALKLLGDLGRACADYQDKALRDLPCKRLQTDEIWAFVGAKEKNVREELRGVWGHGDVWTFVTLCADTKLAVSWLLGTRDTGTATEHMQDVAGRLSRRVQLTTDGHKMYLAAVEDAFGADIDFSQLVKVYGTAPEAEKRYSPPEVIGAKKDKINGHPDPAHVSTSYVERQNLTMRMSMRRFTRLTNAFSKKVENLAAAVALHFMWYNFGRVHQTLRVTPAMEAKVTDHVWTLEEIIGLLEAQEISDRAAASN